MNERGISIPEQMSVIGFDDDRIFSCFSPSITVIAQDFLQIGVEAARLLLEQFQNPEKVHPRYAKFPYSSLNGNLYAISEKELP
ncbi:MAG: substrate-binding domain-containing protein [Lachnospiraceae bacterium]